MRNTVIDQGTLALPPSQMLLHAYRSSFDTTSIRILVCDRNLTVRDVNAACLETEGLDRADFVGRHLADVMGRKVYERRQPHIEAALAGEARTSVEWGLRRATRGQLLRIRHEPVRDEAGEVIGMLLTMEDRTDLHELEQRVSMQDEVISQTSDALAVVDTEFRFLWANPAYAMIWNRLPEEVVGLAVPDVIGMSGFEERVLPHLTRCFAGEVVQYELVSARADGEETHFSVRLEPLKGEDDALIGAIVNMRDVTETALLDRHMRRQALLDTLTELANRHALEGEIAQRIEICANQEACAEGCRTALLLVDLDDFKVVNDLAGHTAGDALLRQVASLLRSLDPNAFVARLGGDEFALVAEVVDEAGAVALGERVVHSIEAVGFSWNSELFSISASVGVALLDQKAFAASTPSVQDVLNWADRACLVAKEKGGARLSVFHADDNEMRARFEEIGNFQVVQNALQHDRFELFVMPVAPVDDTGRPWHEVLLRVLSEDGRPLPPAGFIAAAERHGLMNRVDRWVVETVLRRLPDLPADAYLSINLSGQSVGDPIFCTFLLAALDAAGVAPGRLAFEITETSAVRSMETALELIAGLKARGLGVVLDDFGSGLSSFGYLRRFDVDMLKIDGNIIGNVREDRVQQTIVAGIVAVADVMDVRVVAEYVEDQETLEVLRGLGVSLVQGFYIGKPVSWGDVFGK
jgi:diguanylate cyclase (GGDEF)-like protein/PAS domain S-box-containing protein